MFVISKALTVLQLAGTITVITNSLSLNLGRKKSYIRMAYMESKERLDFSRLKKPMDKMVKDVKIPAFSVDAWVIKIKVERGKWLKVLYIRWHGQIDI